ncbi:MAG TPA: type II secretion system minor pseudopilin GspI [Burkholderiales bacterium]|nr:type II secretion system minor pseudopilin GspI [Burkholderiales bacterium]
MRRAAVCSAGFTLLEVLVALAIVAIGLGAAVRASIQVTSGADALKARTLAVWVAENRLTEHAARRDWPAPGSAQGDVGQGGIAFTWRETVGTTAEPEFRRIEIAVAAASQPGYVLARLTGVLAMPRDK